jgi:hypothetical protein
MSTMNDPGLRDSEDRELQQSTRIRELNDGLRTSDNPLSVLLARGQLMITRGIAARGSDFVSRVMQAVRAFNDFTEDNDPYGEHDFGNFVLDGADVFWKIDYYDNELEYGSPNAADAALTKRVLTVLLAEEY